MVVLKKHQLVLLCKKLRYANTYTKDNEHSNNPLGENASYYPHSKPKVSNF